MKTRKRKGNIALTTVLIVSAILIAGGLTLLLSTIDTTIASKNFGSNTLSQLGIRNCLEETMYRLRTNMNYTGNFTVTYSNGSCTATVTNSTPATTKNVAVTSTYNSYTSTKTYKVDTTTAPMSVSN